VEVSLSVQLGAGKEVDQGSLLNEFVLLINPIVLNLLFGVSQTLVLEHLAVVGPHVGELFVLVFGISIVEYRELWTNNHGIMSDFDKANIVGNQELVMPDHSSEPIVVLPTTESGDGVNRTDIEA